MWPAQAQVAFMQVTGDGHDWVSGDLGGRVPAITRSKYLAVHSLLTFFGR
jgi:hypothetical protein